MEPLKPSITDCPEESGIIMEIEIAPGLIFRMFMKDDVAQEMIDIAQNKINARC